VPLRRDSSIFAICSPVEFLVGEQATLFFSGFDRSGAFLVIVRDMVDAVAHRIATHRQRIIGFQQFGCSSYIFHPRIEPQIIAIPIKNDRHAVVDGSVTGLRTASNISGMANTIFCFRT